jgi:CcmD family protein
MKKFILLICLTLCMVFGHAQNIRPEVEMADQMRANGKIYVVVAVLCVIFAGIVFYLYRIDKRISKLENEIK